MKYAGYFILIWWFFSFIILYYYYYYFLTLYEYPRVKWRIQPRIANWLSFFFIYIYFTIYFCVSFLGYFSIHKASSSQFRHTELYSDGMKKKLKTRQQRRYTSRLYESSMSNRDREGCECCARKYIPHCFRFMSKEKINNNNKINKYIFFVFSVYLK